MGVRRKLKTAGLSRTGARTPSWTSRTRNAWREWYEAKGPVLIFVLKFGFLILLFYAILSTTLCDRALYRYLQANAWLSNIILNWSGHHTQAADITIRSPVFAMALRRGCDAVEPTFLLCSAMLAFRSSIGRKALGMLVGALVFQLLNLVRIVSLFWIGIHFPNLFNPIHMEIWPTLFILIGAVIFVAWKDWDAHGFQPPATA